MSRYWKEKHYGELAKRLSGLMRERGLTPYELSKRAGYEFTSIKRVLNGQPFQFHAMVGIALALGLTIDEILAPIHDMKRNYNLMEEVDDCQTIKIESLV